MKEFKAEKICSGYHEIQVLREISFTVPEGKTLAVVGLNGAGKSTLFQTLAGLIPMTSGKLWDNGQEISSLKAYERVKRGISLVPEGRQVFEELTVDDNLSAGAYLSDRGLVQNKIAVYNLFPDLRRLYKRQAGYLSGGEQQQLAIARAMMSRPRILLLDEPTMGLSVKMAHNVFDTVRMLQKREITIILSGQDVEQTLAVSDLALFIKNGIGEFAPVTKKR